MDRKKTGSHGPCLLVLRQEPGGCAAAHRRPDVYICDELRRAVQRHHRAGARDRGRGRCALAASAGNQGAARPVRHRAGQGQEDPFRGPCTTTTSALLCSEQQGDVEIDKSNILLIGPTGSGKTLLAQTLRASLGALRHRRRHTLTEAVTWARTLRTSWWRCCRTPTMTSTRPAGASSTSTRSTRSREKATAPPSHPRCFRRGRAAGLAQDH